MRVLFIDGAPSAVLLGLSPWILPLIAIAAKRKAYDVDGACCARLLRAWLRMKRNARDAKPEDAARHRATMNKQIKAPLDSIRRD